MSENEFGIKSGKFFKFSTRRMFTVTRRVLRQLVRDRRTFGMILVMPILIMLIFGYALSGEVKNVPIIVINEDEQFNVGTIISLEFGKNITDNLIQDDRVDVSLNYSDFYTSKELVEGGEFSAVLWIPSNFSQTVFQKQSNPDINVSLFLHIDATKPAIRASIIGALQEGLQDALGAAGIEINQTLAFGNAEYSGLDVAIPGVMALVLTFLILLISLITIIREQLYGTAARLFSTPLTKFEKLMGFTIALTVIGFLMVVTVLGIGVFVFGATIKGDIFILIGAAFLYAVAHILLAVFLSNFAQNELQAVQFAPIISFPSMALSGMLVPVNTLPESAQFFAQFIPMTYGVRIFEGVMLKGLTFADLWLDFVILNIFGFLMLLLAIFTVKDKID